MAQIYDTRMLGWPVTNFFGSSTMKIAIKVKTKNKLAAKFKRMTA